MSSRALVSLLFALAFFPFSFATSARFAAKRFARREQERLAFQKKLVELSTNSAQRGLPCGHNMHIECPDALTDAIRTIVLAVRNRAPLSSPR